MSMKFIGKNPDEVFVGNTKTQEGIPPYLQNLHTARIGERALDIEGKELDPAYMRPLFIGRCEIEKYNKIMTKRAERTPQ